MSGRCLISILKPLDSHEVFRQEDSRVLVEESKKRVRNVKEIMLLASTGACIPQKLAICRHEAVTNKS